MGGRFGGWSLYVKDGVLKYVRNYVGIEEYPVVATEPLPTGRTTVRYEFTYEGDGDAGKGGTGALYVNDKRVGEGRIGQTVPYIFLLDETLDIGRDLATPVTDEHAMGDNVFNGTVYAVTIDIGEDAVAYHEPPENIYARLMAGSSAIDKHLIHKHGYTTAVCKETQPWNAH